jgi:hypothetical protein
MTVAGRHWHRDNLHVSRTGKRLRSSWPWRTLSTHPLISFFFFSCHRDLFIGTHDSSRNYAIFPATQTHRCYLSSPAFFWPILLRARFLFYLHTNLPSFFRLPLCPHYLRASCALPAVSLVLALCAPLAVSRVSTARGRIVHRNLPLALLAHRCLLLRPLALLAVHATHAPGFDARARRPHRTRTLACSLLAAPHVPSRPAASALLSFALCRRPFTHSALL